MRIEIRGLDDRHEEIIPEMMQEITVELKEAFPQSKACGWRFAFPKDQPPSENRIFVRVFVSRQNALVRKDIQKAIKDGVKCGISRTLLKRKIRHLILGVRF